MAIDLWNDDDEEFSGEYVQESGGDFPIIPHNTRHAAMVDKVLWEKKTNYKNEKKEENCVSIRFEIVDGEFKGQKIFKKMFIESDNDDVARKDYTMLMHIDTLAGGKIKAARRRPSDADLQKYLIAKEMLIVVGMMIGKDGQKDNNYLMGVSSGKVAQKKAELEDADIPF